MNPAKMTVLVVGATGSIGRLVVAEALRQGHSVRALVRDLARGRALPQDAQVVVGDLTRAETLAAAVEGITAVVFTHGSSGGGKAGAEQVDYGAVRTLRPTRAHRADDGDRRDKPRRRLQPLNRDSRLEAPRRAPGARQRLAVHDRAARLV
jgi:hypothetical protein